MTKVIIINLIIIEIKWFKAVKLVILKSGLKKSLKTQTDDTIKYCCFKFKNYDFKIKTGTYMSVSMSLNIWK